MIHEKPSLKRVYLVVICEYVLLEKKPNDNVGESSMVKNIVTFLSQAYNFVY